MMSNAILIDGLSVKGGLTARRPFIFGPTYVVEPKGKHQATVVWLHGLGDDGLRSNGFALLLRLNHSPYSADFLQPHIFNNGDILTALESNIACNCRGFDVKDMSENTIQDLEGLDASAIHVLSFLSNEPPNVKLGVGGFSMGAAAAIYSAHCYARGKIGNGMGFSAHLDAVVGLSGWLPCARELNDEVEGYRRDGRAASLPILLCHGRGDDVVHFRHGVKSAEKLTSAGFENLTFKPFNSLGHNIIPEEMDVVSTWLSSKLELEGGFR